MKKYEISKVPDELLKEEAAQDAVFSFNLDPNKGIIDLCNNHNVDIDSPSGVAHALRNSHGLIGAKIGSFLLETDKEPILKEFFKTFDLKGPILSALRSVFTDSMDLPKDTDSIDHFIRVFGDAYFEENCEKYASSTIPYELSFAIVLLNSDLNNPQQKKNRKMTEVQFIQNIRTVLSEDIIPDNELVAIYHEIKVHPIVKRFSLSQVMDEEQPRYKGILCKKGSRWSSGKDKFYVLCYNCLFYFKLQDETVNVPAGMIQLHNVDVMINDSKQKYFTIASNNDKDISCVKYNKPDSQQTKGIRVIHFKAKTKELRDEWILHIARSMLVYSEINKIV